jgi:beta-1,4-mannosyltransferase
MRTITRVLEAVAPPAATTRFVDQIVQMAPDDVHFSFFSWRNVLLGRYDVVHYHWPEHLIRDDRRFRRSLKRALFRAMVLRLKLQRTRVIRTIHNLTPHTPGDPGEQRLLKALDRVVSHYVVLNGCTPRPAAPTTLIRHGHYRDQFVSHGREESVSGRLLFCGRIEPYKGLLELLDVVSEEPTGVSELRVVGKPVPSMVAPVEEGLGRYRGSVSVTATLAHVPDDHMVREVTAAEAVILPYRELHNSGIALVALSLNRPVIVPQSCVMSEISEEVGPGWVIEYAGDLSRDSLAAAIDRLRATPRSASPALRTRDWQYVADSYATVFRGVNQPGS